MASLDYTLRVRVREGMHVVIAPQTCIPTYAVARTTEWCRRERFEVIQITE